MTSTASSAGDERRSPALGSVVVLLRGINVGGKHRLPMAEVREILTTAGFDDVRTYIQSGNIVLRSALLPGEVAARVRALLEAHVGFPIPTIALTGEHLRRILAENPFSPEAAKLEHVVLLPEPLDQALRERLEALAAADTTSSSLAFGERCVYLHHPDGLMSSPLAQKATALLPQGTARNLASLRALEAMLG